MTSKFPRLRHTSSNLKLLGQALYGDKWQAPMAYELQVDETTVRGWLSGRLEIPREIWNALGKICHAHGRALLDLAERLGVQD